MNKEIKHKVWTQIISRSNLSKMFEQIKSESNQRLSKDDSNKVISGINREIEHELWNVVMKLKYNFDVLNDLNKHYKK